MATNIIYDEAVQVPLPVPSGTVSGDPVIVGALAGVAITDADADDFATVKLNGGAELDVAGTVDVGDEIWMDGSGDLNAAGGVGTNLFGTALTAGTDTVITVKPTSRSVAGA